MIRLFLAVAVIPWLGACVAVGHSSAPEPAIEERTGPMLTVLTSSDPETQLMALVLTRAAHAQGGHPRILLCSAAGDLALRTPPAEALAPLQPKGASPAVALRQLMAEGIKVEVCAIYLPNRPFGPDALEDGVGVANPAEIAGVFAADKATVLSF